MQRVTPDAATCDTVTDDGVEHAAHAAALASAGGATLAVHYRTLTVEDLI